MESSLLSGLLAFVVAICVSFAAVDAVSASDFCPPLALADGPIVTVSTVAELHTAVRASAMGETILITAGTYDLLEALWGIAPGVTVRGATSDGNDVILGMFTLYDPSTLTNQMYLPMLLRN